MTRPPFNLWSECVKCRAGSTKHRVTYRHHGKQFDGSVVDEFLMRECLRCGYEWEEAVCG